MYKIDRTGILRESKEYQRYIVAGYVLMVILELLMIITWKPFFWHLISLALGICLVYYGKSNQKLLSRRSKKYDKLEKSGVLVKGLNYSAKATGKKIGNDPVYKIVANYATEGGQTMRLMGEELYNRKVMENNKVADVLIDPTDLSNYFIGFNISPVYDYIIKEENEDKA